MGVYGVELEGHKETIKVTYNGVTIEVPIEEANRAEEVMLKAIADIDHEIGVIRAGKEDYKYRGEYR